MISARSRSLAALTTSAALAPSPLMRMSSGPSCRNEKPRSAAVELHRGDAEIEHDAVDRLVAGIARDRVEIGKAIFDQCQAAAAPARPGRRPSAIAV